MAVFMPMCVCKWRGDERILKKLSASAGVKTSRRCSQGTDTKKQLDVDWTENSETLCGQDEIGLELSLSKELFFPEVSFSNAD